MNVRELIDRLAGADPDAVVWVDGNFFDELGDVIYERESETYSYVLLRGKVKGLAGRIDELTRDNNL